MTTHTQSGSRFAALFTVLALIFAFAARQYLHRYIIPAPAAVAIYFCFLLLLFLALAPALEPLRFAVRTVFPGRKKLFFPAILLLPYLIYAAGTRDFRWASLFRLVTLAAPAPLLYLALPVRKSFAFCWQDALLGTWMMAAVLAQGLRGVFAIPVNLDFLGRLFLLVVASWTWTFVRPVPALGYELSLSRRVLLPAALNFTFFAVLAAPLGLALHFIAWNPHWSGLGQFALDYLEIFLFIALLEELFFRGFLQNLLSRTLPKPWAGQLLASCLFGLTHILHAPVPNWRYVALASLAGWFYGSAYRASGSVFVSSLTHALVDTAWRTWFLAPIAR